MKNRIIIREFKESLILGIKIGILGAILGLIFHSIWGNFDAIFYTVINGFIIGYIIGFIETIIFYTKIGRLPYSVLLLLRIVLYFIITLTSIYAILLIYLKSKGLESSSLSDPQVFDEIRKVYFLTNINTIYVIIISLPAISI